jgi:hypothetical protein
MDLFFPLAATALFLYFMWKRPPKAEREVEMQIMDPMEESGNEADDELDVVLLTKPISFKGRDNFYGKSD